MSPDYDCIIIGGGVIGLACAERLSRDKLSVLLLERGRCGQRASWAAAGILSQPDPLRKDTGAHLQRRSVAMFPEFCAQLHQTSGVDPEYWPCGSIEVYHEDQQWRMGQSKLFPRRDGAEAVTDPDWQLLEPAQLRRQQPGVSAGALGGLQCQGTAQVRTPRLLQALEQSCRHSGVMICEHQEVTHLHARDDELLEVRCQDGVYLAGKVVIANGAWASGLSSNFGPVADVHPVRGQILLLDGAGMLGLNRIVQDRFCYLVPRRDGLLLLGATVEPEAGFAERVTRQGYEEMLAAGAHLMPGVAELPVLAAWAGLRPQSSENLPCIGISRHHPGIILATGHYRTGIALAPLTAEAVADLLFTGRTNRLGRLSAHVIRDP